MGFFSFFRSRDPEKVAKTLVRAALDHEVSPEEVHWIRQLVVELPCYIAERNALRVGMTQAGVALILRDTRVASCPGYKLELEVMRQFEAFFMTMPNVTPESGQGFYRALSSRYIVREPAEMARIFHYYLLNPNAWPDPEIRSSPPYEIPDGFETFVHALAEEPLQTALMSTIDIKGLR